MFFAEVRWKREANIETPVEGTKWRLAGTVVFPIAAVLLISMGGAVVAAPVTVPLMFLAAQRHLTTTCRVTGVFLGGLTAAEVVWAVTYLQLGESQPWIWLLPMVGGVIAALIFGAGTNPALHRRAAA